QTLAVVSDVGEGVYLVLARRDVRDIRLARGAGARVVRRPLAGNAAADRRDRAKRNAVRRGEREAVVEGARLAEAEEKDALRGAAVRAGPGDPLPRRRRGGRRDCRPGAW